MRTVGMYAEAKETYDTAIKALEKQIPMKPVFLDRDGEYCKCPVCGKFAVNDFGCRYKFCCGCGQALDQSE